MSALPPKADHHHVDCLGHDVRSDRRILVRSRIEGERLWCRVMISGAKACENFPRCRVGITKAAACDGVASFNESAQRPLALLVRQVSPSPSRASSRATSAGRSIIFFKFRYIVKFHRSLMEAPRQLFVAARSAPACEFVVLPISMLAGLAAGQFLLTESGSRLKALDRYRQPPAQNARDLYTFVTH